MEGDIAGCERQSWPISPNFSNISPLSKFAVEQWSSEGKDRGVHPGAIDDHVRDIRRTPEAWWLACARAYARFAPKPVQSSSAAAICLSITRGISNGRSEFTKP